MRGNYLQRTRIPTYHFQASLPRLPVPKLAETIERYLYFASPLVPAARLDATRQSLAAWKDGEGAKLQAEIERRAAATYSSYISAPWFDMYLKDRRPIALNSNPHLGFKDDDDVPARGAQAARAARLIDASVGFYRTLRDLELEPDIFHTKPHLTQTRLWESFVSRLPRSVSFYGAAAFGAYPLDMSQYDSLFESTRIPKRGRDELRKAKPAGTPARHVVVQRGARFYELACVGADGHSVGARALERALCAILSAADAGGAGPAPLGLLTSLPRDEWADARAAIEASSPASAAALRAIDDALFCVTLDHASPSSLVDVNNTFLHGDGSNRWFDKSFQLIVTANAKAAVNFEHSWGDGVAVLRYFNSVWEAAKAAPVLPAGERAEPAQFRELRFDALPASVLETVAAAKARLDAHVRSMHVDVVESAHVGSSWAKSNKLSPDGLMQMTLQLAHHALHGKAVSTYESASTAAFKHGRTETIRAATPESAALCAVFADRASPATERVAALRAAVAAHSSITRDCLMGKGVDRHLFALRALGSELGGAPPRELDDDTYRTLAEIIISTSTLSSEALADGGFGPVGPNCYAAGYGILPEGCRYVLRSQRDDVARLGEAITTAQAAIRAAVEAAPQPARR